MDTHALQRLPASLIGFVFQPYGMAGIFSRVRALFVKKALRPGYAAFPAAYPGRFFYPWNAFSSSRLECQSFSDRST